MLRRSSGGPNLVFSFDLQAWKDQSKGKQILSPKLMVGKNQSEFLQRPWKGDDKDIGNYNKSLLLRLSSLPPEKIIKWYQHMEKSMLNEH